MHGTKAAEGSCATLCSISCFVDSQEDNAQYLSVRGSDAVRWFCCETTTAHKNHFFDVSAIVFCRRTTEKRKIYLIIDC